MTFIKIICPKCNAEAKLSLVDANYTGPRRCWKCHEAFNIKIVNNQVVSSEPLSQEDFNKIMEAKKAQDKAEAQGFTFSKREEPETREAPSQQGQQQEFFRPNQYNPKQPPHGAEPVKSSGTFPPDKFNTFIPIEDVPEKPKKQEKPKNPPERFNIFIPPQT